MSLSSYDQLLKQVETLESENNLLRQELQGSSSHLTKLENKASSMKDVLMHLGTTMRDDIQNQFNRSYQNQHQSNENLDQNSNESGSEDNILESEETQQQCLDADSSNMNTQPPSSLTSSGMHKMHNNDPAGTPSKKHNIAQNQAMYSLAQELEQERGNLLREIKNEEQHRKWYCEQIEHLNEQINSLPVSDTYNLQADMSRRQLECEAKKLREKFAEALGSADQVSQRQEARLARIRMVEAEMLQLQQRHHDQFEQDKRDVGSCDLTETEREGLISLDAGSSSFLSAKDFGRSITDDSSCGSPERQQFELHSTEIHQQTLASLYHGAWPIDKGDGSFLGLPNQETASVMSFHSSSVSASTGSRSRMSAGQQRDNKTEMVYSLLSMLGTHDNDDMSRTLLAMSSSQDSCIAMRQSGCLPLLIQLLHGSDKDSSLLGKTRGSKSARARAAAALHNIVHSHPDDKRGRREARVLRLLEQIRAHCDQLRDDSEEEHGDLSRPSSGGSHGDMDHRPGPAIAALMKLSFDEEHRHAICILGGLQAIAELLLVDHKTHGNTIEQYNITMRRYACMALTNLTFGDGTNKALLCSMTSCMRALVAQLESPNEDLRQVAASVLRNLSWRADLQSKKTLREVGTVPSLTQAAMEVNKESTLKSVLSALWNLSAHCSENKADICAVDGALGFLVSTLTYKSPTKTLSIVENGGGILRNISSHIAVREDYRKILRQHGCLTVLLKHLRSPSLTIVSNACGTLWNLSARCPEDQQALWDMGAVSMLRNLVHSKHKMISMGSAAALKNLLAAKPSLASLEADRLAKPNMPTLHVRKQRALEAEIDQSLSETCENIESPQDSPKEHRKRYEHNRGRLLYNDVNGVHGLNQNEIDHKRMIRQRYLYQRNGPIESTPKVSNSYHGVERASSQDSVSSVHSDISHDRVPRSVFMKNHNVLQDRAPVDQHETSNYEVSYNSAERHLPNSRIVQVMQEVALHAGLPPANFTANKETKQQLNGSGIGLVRDTQKANMFPRSHAQNMSKQGAYLSNTVPAHQQSPKTPNRTMNGLFNLPNNYQYQHQSEEQDQPINYSMKYPENQTENSTENDKETAQMYQFSRPNPQVGNYVGNMKHIPKNSSMEKHASEKRPSNGAPNLALNSSIHRPRDYPQFSHGGYAETDLDHEDQPTNYSIRFTEIDEESRYSGDQPINYSTRFKQQEENCADCKLEEARRTNDLLEQSANDDVLQTFCTEGTPYLSTATSLTDLSKAVKTDSKTENGYGANRANIQDNKDTENQKNIDSRYSERSDSCSTDAKTGSTVIPNLPCTSIQSMSVNPPNISNSNSSGPSIQSFNDTSGSTSPSEKPTTYCTEGTPMCFSRASSLSSLHSSDNKDSGNHSQKSDIILPSIDENNYLDTSQNQNDTTLRPHDETLKPDSANTTTSQGVDSANTSGHGKTVTFDDNNQIQETPLVFSRCSSLGSLSSFDAHSVHSSVISEYSRRASEVVSPSELPDSPGDTMPPTPTHRKSPPPKFDLKEKNKELGESPLLPKNVKSVNSTPRKSESCIPEEQSTPVVKQPSLPEPIIPTQEKTVSYDIEGTPDFSCATSLSALTIDDDIEITKDPGLRRVPLGQENEPTEQTRLIEEMDEMFGETLNKTAQSVDIKPPPVDLKPDVEDFSFDDVSSPSEGEEEILAECISLAMPTNSKKNKMKKSSSDTQLRRRALFGKTDRSNSQEPVTPQSKWNKHTFPQSTPKMSASYGPVTTAPCDFGDVQDTTTSYATEGTPVHISHAGSFSDLSNTSALLDEGDTTLNKSQNKSNLSKSRNECDDVKSDVSSVSEDCEDLLSEAIEAAMPKSTKKNKPIDRTAEGAERKDKFRYQNNNVPIRRTMPTRFEPMANHSTDSMKPNMNHDTVITYAEEGTPIEFSRATSLSDLTDLHEVENPVSKPAIQTFPQRSNTVPQQSAPPPPYMHPPTLDSPKVFGIEGTPMSFSRNDSLSSLSCEEDLETSPEKFQKTSVTKESSESKSNAEKFIPSPFRKAHPRSGTSSPGGLRAKITVNLAKSQHGHSGLSPSKHDVATNHMPENDHTKTYAVEGTPMCFSTHSSLSSLNSDDHEGLANRSPNADDVHAHHQNESFKLVEDTPMCFSQNSSLSSLSVESLSSEPTASEKALLEECINSAMPKAVPKGNRPLKMSKIPRTSPTGASDGKIKKKSPKSPDSQNQKLYKSNIKLKNSGQKQDSNEEYVPKEEPVRHTKEVKDHSNQEKCQTTLNSEFVSPRSCQRRLDFERIEPPCTSTNEVLPLAEAVLADTVDNKIAEMEKSASTVDEDKDGFEKEKSLQDKETSEKQDSEKLAHFELTDSMEREAANLVFDMENQLSEISRGIDEESFPDMGVSGSSISWSMVSMTASGDKILDDTNEDSANKEAELNENIVPEDIANITGEECSDSHNVSSNSEFQSANTTTESEDANITVVPNDVDTGGIEISPEEEIALAENANIILSELAMKRELSSSTLDTEDMLENETMSLVSVDYTSDTASEMSATLSASSKTISENKSEISEASSVRSPHKGARVVKPFCRDIVKQDLDEKPCDKGPKPIRGRRKSGSSIKSTGSNGSGKFNLKGESLLKGKGPSTPPRNSSRSLTPTRAGLVPKKTPPKGGAARSVGRSASPAMTQASTSTGFKSSSTPKADKSSIPGRTTPGKQITKSASGSKLVKGATGITRQSSQSKIATAKKEPEQERPKPPRKEGTFTKDSPTHSNAPQISDSKDSSPRSETENTKSESDVSKAKPRTTGAWRRTPSKPVDSSSSSDESRRNSDCMDQKASATPTRTSVIPKKTSKSVGGRSVGRSSSPATPPRASSLGAKPASTPKSEKTSIPGRTTPVKQIPKSASGSKLTKGVTGITRQGSQSKIATAKKETEKKESEKEPDRPKPPRKEGTFIRVKENPTQNGPSQMNDTKETSPKSNIPLPSTNNNVKVSETGTTKSESDGSKMKPPPPIPPRTSSVWRKSTPKPVESNSSSDESKTDTLGKRAPPVPEHRRNSDSMEHGREPKPGPSGIGDIWIKRSHSSLSSSSSSLGEPELPKSKLTNKPLPPAPTQTATQEQAVSEVTKMTNKAERKQSPATNAAIVQPFNYNPNQIKAPSTGSSVTDAKTKTDSSTPATAASQKPASQSPTPARHLTKTEMLIARRRQSYLNSLKKEESDSDSNDKKSSCLVTTV